MNEIASRTRKPDTCPFSITTSCFTTSAHPMPVAPTFQPDVAAKAIVFLARHPRRNMWVGISTTYTILGERIAPKLLDIYLGRTGMKAQQTDKKLPRWGSNVFEAKDTDSDRGAHGPFDSSAHDRDPQVWMSMHRRALGAGLLAVASSAIVAAFRSPRRSAQ